MDVNFKKIICIILLFLGNIFLVFSTNVTIIEGNHGTKNYLLALYLIFLLVFWFIIYRNTSDIKINDKKIIVSLFNSTIRLLCYIWFIVIFWTSRAILFISTNENFLSDKLFIINILFYFSLIIFSIYMIINVIKYWGKVSGVEEFLKKVIYEVKNYDE